MTDGNNGYSASVGYDLVTGIGTPKAPAIVDLLSTFSTTAAVMTANSAGDGGGYEALSTGGSQADPTTQEPFTNSLSTSQTANLPTPSSDLGSLSDLLTTTDASSAKKNGSFFARWHS